MFEYDKNCEWVAKELDKYNLKQFLKVAYRRGYMEINEVFQELIQYLSYDIDPGLATALDNYWGLNELKMYLQEKYNIKFYEVSTLYMRKPEFKEGVND